MPANLGMPRIHPAHVSYVFLLTKLDAKVTLFLCKPPSSLFILLVVVANDLVRFVSCCSCRLKNETMRYIIIRSFRIKGNISLKDLKTQTSGAALVHQSSPIMYLVWSGETDCRGHCYQCAQPFVFSTEQFSAHIRICKIVFGGFANTQE